MAHKKAGGSSRNGRDFEQSAARPEDFRRRAGARRQHHRAPTRHQVASRAQCRPGQGPYAVRADQRSRRVPYQSQRPRLRIGSSDDARRRPNRRRIKSGPPASSRTGGPKRVPRGETGCRLPSSLFLRSPCHDFAGSDCAGELAGEQYSRPRDRAARLARAASRGRESDRHARSTTAGSQRIRRACRIPTARGREERSSPTVNATDGETVFLITAR